MNYNSDYYKHLYQKFLNDEISSSEIKELLDFISNNSESINFLTDVDEDEIIFEKLVQSDEISESTSKRMRDRLIKQIKKSNNRFTSYNSSLKKDKTIPLIKYWAAASIIILGSILFWFVNQSNHYPQIAKIEFKNEINDIASRDNDALLTLSDGSQIVLNSDSTGLIALQGSSVINIKNGYLIYEKNRHPKTTNDVAYNTINTPKGKNFRMLLSDSTFVLLNAESSISYPADFTNLERRINITGEVYFEVAKDKSRPFIVSLDKDTEIRVLGTNFNVNSYSIEKNIKATLLEGSIQIKYGKRTKLLNPGEQAQISKENEINIITAVNLNHIMAWKNGTFSFVDEELSSVMGELTRWYDMEVEYSGEIPKIKFTGEIGKNLTLSQVLLILKHARVKYTVANKKVIISAE